MADKINDCRKETAVILPSLDPDKKFTGVVKELIENGFEKIVIVDDGSTEQRQCYFKEAELYSQVKVIHHGVNKGKGRALKTAFDYTVRNLPEVRGVITIDGDGQHLTKDIIACGDRMLSEENNVVLGCRDFSLPDVPPRSVAGNRFTSKAFRLLFGIKLSDTQTGLRAIPAKYLAKFCEIPGERFEYETNMLLQMKREGIEFSEQAIETVYDKDDYSSHYNAMEDSWKIGKVMLKFLISGSGFRYLLSSCTAWIIDVGIYYLLMKTFGLEKKTLFYIIGKALSSFYNFNINKYFAFRSAGSYRSECFNYYCLCVSQTAISLLMVNLTQRLLGVTAPGLAAAVKICIEAVIFFISYYIQKRWVFRKK